MSRAEPIVPARLDLREGAAYSERFGDIYWSLGGGLAETRHVFLQGNRLPERWHDGEPFVILETGFGTGLNFLATWHAWRAAGARGSLHYVSIDRHPFTAADLATLYSQWPELQREGADLLAQYPPLLPGFHRLHLGCGRLNLTLMWGDVAALLPQLQARVAAFFLDGFAPAKNPDMWSDEVCRELGRLAAPGATLATYTVAGDVRRALAGAGFVVEKRPGYGSKREMLTGQLAGATQTSPSVDRHAIIIGAGLAGSACAERLAHRGWHVDLVERRDGPARETSGNPAGLIQPVPSADWNRLSRISFAGFYYALRQLARFHAAGMNVTWQRCGVLRLARHERHARKQAEVAASGLLPQDVMRFVDMEEAAALCGARVAAPGWWFPDGAWVHPASLCDALLRASARSVRPLFLSDACSLERGAGGWRVAGPDNRTIAEAAVVILANGYLARRFGPAARLPLRPVRGQITCFPAQPARALRAAVAREGYVTPATPWGVHVVGATYEEGSTDATTRIEDHRANLARLEAIVPGFAPELDAGKVAGRTGIRSVGPDRLPLAGALPAFDGGAPPQGLYGLLGLGSRGLVFAPLAAELLAAQLNGEPLPVERDIAGFLDPARVVGMPERRGGADDA